MPCRDDSESPERADVGLVFSSRALDGTTVWTRQRLHGGSRGNHRLGGHRSPLPLLGYLAAHHQHRHNHRDVPDGVPYPEHTEPRHRSQIDELTLLWQIMADGIAFGIPESAYR